MTVLALDVGYGTIRSSVLDVTAARPVGSTEQVEYVIDQPKPEASEVPADRLWSAVTSAARAVALPEEGIEGVGLSVLTPALVVLDEKDQPAAPIRLPQDRRARRAARQVQADVGGKFLAEAGNRPLPGGISAVAFRQMVVDDPYLIREVHRYLHLNSWLALRMTGQTAFDPANASLSGLFSTMMTGQWSPRWCEYFEVDPAWLPPVTDGRATVGTIRSAVAAELGVPAGIPLKLGTCQLYNAMIAAGTGLGDLYHYVGESQLLAAITDRPVADERRLVFRCGFGDGYVQAACNPISGTAIHWLHALCFREQSEQEFHERTIPQALERETRVTLDPPNLADECLELEARRAAFRDLTLETDRLDLLAALLGELRRQFERALAALHPSEPWRRVLLTGIDAALVRQLIPGYAAPNVQILDRDGLGGIARLFHE